MIRPYEDADLQGVIAAWESASRLAHPFLDEEFLASERRAIPENHLPVTETWVSVVDGRVVGFLSLLGNEVGAIFLDPAFHGRGLGRELMDKARELRDELVVEVFEANPIGRRFYERYGFELLERKDHEPTGQPILRLRLAPAGT